MFKNEIPKFSEIVEKWDQINEEYNPLSSREQMRMGQQRMNNRGSINNTNNSSSRGMFYYMDNLQDKNVVGFVDSVRETLINLYLDYRGSQDDPDVDVEESKEFVMKVMKKEQLNNPIVNDFLKDVNMKLEDFVSFIDSSAESAAYAEDYVDSETLVQTWNENVKDVLPTVCWELLIFKETEFKL